MSTSCLLILILILQIKFISSSCVYSSTVPSPGECKGPLERTIAKRSTILSLNSGCEIDQIPFSIDNDFQKISCGECIPGTHGNWRFSGIPNYFSSQMKSLSCSSQADNFYDGHSTVNPGEKSCLGVQTSAEVPLFFCGANQFCTDNGTCSPLKEHPLYKADCSSLSESERQDPWACGLPGGLSCIENKCQVCISNPSPGDFFLPVSMRTPAICIDNGLYIPSWSTVFADPESFWLIVAWILIFSIFSYLGGLYSYLKFYFRTHYPFWIPTHPISLSIPGLFNTLFYWPWHDFIQNKRNAIKEELTQRFIQNTQYTFEIIADEPISFTEDDISNNDAPHLHFDNREQVISSLENQLNSVFDRPSIFSSNIIKSKKKKKTPNTKKKPNESLQDVQISRQVFFPIQNQKHSKYE